MKLIFLDIDGVLNSERWKVERTVLGDRGYREAWKDKAERGLDPDAVGRLSYLIERTRARIVVTSSWRKEFSLTHLDRMLRYRGLGGQWLLGATPSCKHTLGTTERGVEISAWLGMLWDRQPESFVVLDDDRDMAPYLGHLVQTDNHVGLTDADCERAFSILCAPSEEP